MDGQQEPAFTVAELAERWNYHQRTILRAIARGRLQAFRPGRDWRIPAWAVAEIERSAPHSQRQTAR